MTRKIKNKKLRELYMQWANLEEKWLEADDNERKKIEQQQRELLGVESFGSATVEKLLVLIETVLE
ncbi:MAG: hypothetical protein DRJ03_03960 [Chloroflexi bacterium]|nr:MAG: hypothetical protein DRJ03_03960 [Chloroflexota bacterium]